MMSPAGLGEVGDVQEVERSSRRSLHRDQVIAAGDQQSAAIRAQGA